MFKEKISRDDDHDKEILILGKLTIGDKTDPDDEFHPEKRLCIDNGIRFASMNTNHGA